MELIASRQNPLVKRFRDLARRQDAATGMLLDGQHLVEEAVASGAQVEVVALTDAAAERQAPLVAQLQAAGVRTVTVTVQVLEAISPVRQPSGVVGIASRPEATLDDVLRGQPPLILMLSEVQDPGNVGAIVRAAEACGATGVVAGGGTADPFGWKALRGSMGSSFRMPIVRCELGEAIGRARAAGLRVFATTARDGVLLPACDLRVPSALILGGEGAGLRDEWIDAADARITIPMREPVESLNVSVAAALLLYEASRQRS